MPLKGAPRCLLSSKVAPHGPAMCVCRRRTLRSYRLLFRDLTLPHDNTVYAASVGCSVGNCATAECS
jgi:hypothetical protein